MFFIETPAFSRRYVYLGGYVLGKLQRSGGGTFIWGGTSIWHRIVQFTGRNEGFSSTLILTEYYSTLFGMSAIF